MDGIYIAGPTASGKSGLAVSLARRLGGEIINADSMQIYSELLIGTARPSREEMMGVPHHLFGFVHPLNGYSAAQYVHDALKAAGDVHHRGRLPIFTGGTGLYMDALLYKMDFGETAADENMRRELKDYAERRGSEALHDLLAQLDAQSAARINHNDVKRVIRAIEVYNLTGRSIGDYSSCREKRQEFQPFLIGLNAGDRQYLYNRIDKRTELMFKEGLPEEAGMVLEKWPDSQAAKAIGYKEFSGFFAGEISLEQAKELIKRNTRRYAKRQLTWFKRNKAIHWLDIEGLDGEGLFEKALELISNNINI